MKPLRVLALLAVAAVALATPTARADGDKEICVRAVERAQVARLDGKLRKAREGFVTCARPVCPDAIREDCTRWVGEVDASLPSVVFEAVWADGRDATAMAVQLDGQTLVGADVGRAVTLDPGEHLFRFEVAGAVPVETRNVIREGEKNRILRVTFTPAPAPPPPPVVAPAPSPAPEPVRPVSAPPGLWREVPGREHPARASSRGPVPVSAWILGGLGLASIGAFAGLGLDGTGQLDSMRNTCVHTCDPSRVSSARNEILAGDILGIVGLAATGLAAWLMLTRPDAPVLTGGAAAP